MHIAITNTTNAITLMFIVELNSSLVSDVSCPTKYWSVSPKKRYYKM